MKTHAWFGNLAAAKDGSFDFDKLVSIGSDDVLVSIHFDGIADVSDATLDAVATQCQQLEQRAATARAAMSAELNDPESATATYFDFLKGEAPDLLGKTTKPTFVAALKPEKLWAWFSTSISPTGFSLQFDFNIAPGEIDHVLCATFDATGALQSIEIES